jgi:hypothetical protein
VPVSFACFSALRMPKMMKDFHHKPIETISCIMNDIQLHRLDLNLLVPFEALMTEGSVAKAAA